MYPVEKNSSCYNECCYGSEQSYYGRNKQYPRLERS